MEKEDSLVKWFSELSNKDISIAGGKGASLSEMFNVKVPVPAGFVVTAQAYDYFLKTTKIKEKLREILEKVDVNDTKKLNIASKEIRKTIEVQEFPSELKEEILESYEILNAKKSDEALGVLNSSSEESFVAVRSSATTEDLADASFAGQQESFLNVRGGEQLLNKVKKCMSSLYTPRAIYYRNKKGFDHSKSLLAVVVQKMINSKKSGVLFSQSPTNTDKSIVIEAVFGLGEGIVSGQIKPDHYQVNPDLENFTILEEKISTKKIAIIRNEDGNNETVKLTEEESKKKVLNNYEIKRLAQYAKQLEEHYKKPQDIEFAIDETGIYIVQSRPITTTAKEDSAELAGEPILEGLGASPGVASGVVKVINLIEELEKVKTGDILVTEMTNPDMVVSMQKSAAIVTNEGGVTSHAAIVSREMGIPAVVGTGDATEKLKDGDEITVDGTHGKVYAGKSKTKLVEIRPIVPTKTKIKVIADLPVGAERASKSEAKSIGLVRLEGIIATGGKHPLSFVKDKQLEKYIQLLTENLEKIVKHYEEVWVRSSDIRTDEYSNLEGAPQEKESNPMMGDHGIRFSLKYQDILEAEFKAINIIAEKFPGKKIGLMVPLLIRLEELKKTKEIAKAVGIGKNVKIGIMVETPSAVQIIEELCEEGIDFVSFGTNDLTQFTLAIDRNNENVQKIYDETHPAVLRSIAHVIKVCKQYGVETSICGQAGSRPEMAKFLVEQGIDSISVNADAAYDISKIVSELEGVSAESLQEETFSQTFHSEKRKCPQEENSQQKRKALLNVPEEMLNKDIEESVLEALDDDYNPGEPQSNKQEIPPLNEALPVDESLNPQPSEEEIQLQIEKEIESEVKDELSHEWKGERPN